MAKSQENGTTILLRPKSYEVVMVSEEEKGIMVEVKDTGEKSLIAPPM